MALRQRLAGLGCALALVGCQPPAAPSGNGAADKAAPRAAAAPNANEAAAPAAPAANASSAEGSPEKAIEVPEDSPGLADMSPSRRRAYEAGYRDCSAGRYDPDPWPEAYRIGCGAAQEAQ